MIKVAVFRCTLREIFYLPLCLRINNFVTLQLRFGFGLIG